MQNDESDLSLEKAFSILWNQKLIIGLFVLAFSIISIIVAINLSNIYVSKATLAPAKNEKGVGDAFQYRGLANLAGINLPSSSSSSADEAVKIISSFHFFENNILPNIYLPNLMALDYWDPVTNENLYDSKIYNNQNSLWVREVKFPKKPKPSPQESYKAFRDIFSLNVDKDSGFVFISIESQSPQLGKKWLDIIISEINSTLRSKEKEQTLKSIEYINLQISQTSFSEIKQAMSLLLQQETEKMMLIEANEDYVFKLIDPPFAPEEKSKPSRAIICIFGAILGFILGLFVALIRSLILDRRK